MDLTKKNIKKILAIITFGIVLFTISQNLTSVVSFLKGILDILAPLLVGFCLAFILNIPMNILEKKVFKKMGESNKKAVNKALRPVSLISTLVLMIAFIALLLFIIIPQLHKSIVLIVEKFPTYYGSVVGWIESLVTRFNLDINTEVLHNPKFNIETITSVIEKYFTFESASDILNTTVGVTSSVISAITNLVIGFIVALYILAEKEDIGKFINNILAKSLPEKVHNRILEVFSVASSSFSNFITGQFTDAFVLAVLCFIGMSIFRFPNAAVVSVIIGITALIPVIGPLIGEFIGCFIIFMESPLKALFFLIFVLILQAIDNNFIYPKVVGKSVGLPGILVLLAVIIGGNISGILGVLLGVPVASAIYSLVVAWLNNKSKTVAVSDGNENTETDNSEEIKPDENES